MKALVRHVLYAAILIAAGVLCAVVVVYVMMLQRFPDLKPWHSVDLAEDFSAEMPVDTLSGYLDVETRAFAELHAKILDHIDPEDQFAFNRYSRGSRSDPEAAQRNWNRTFELDAPNPRGGVLLLHGLSDSPYSLRSTGEQLNDAGWLVLGLRMPAHGTAPGALREFKRDDARAATKIGVRHLRQRLGVDAPIMIVGYSNGAALAIDYVLAAGDDPALPAIDGLILMSPAIAVAPIAAFAVWQARVGDLLGVDKLAWQSIVPEFDPYKYNSFAVRAGDQTYRLTEEVNQQLLAFDQNDVVDRFPATLVFQSVTDATVQAPAVVTRFLDRIAANGSALVLYDVNRNTDTEALYVPNVGAWIDSLIATRTSYSVTLLSNRLSDSDQLDSFDRPANATEAVRERLNLAWPSNVFALSHVSLPFSPNDPVYGVSGDGGKLLHIGGIEIRGETGVLAVPAFLLTRLRHNPFYSYQAHRIRQFADQIVAARSEPHQ